MLYKRVASRWLKASLPKAPKIKDSAEAQRIQNMDWESWERVHLPDDPSKYFLNDKDLVKIPVGQIRRTRARAGGIVRANRLMWLAYNGMSPKRQPITLKREKDGVYSVVDGNSTFTNIMDSNWKVVWATLSP